MLVVISPAKKLNWATPDVSALDDPATTDPAFPSEAAELAGIARGLGVDELRKLMGISESLARLNAERFRTFSPAPGPDTLRPAALAFAGDTYRGLEARTLDADALRWAQSHLRILSGLYGLLRPLDRIQPYRLEMGCRLATPRGKSLYDYWGDRLAKALNAAAKAAGADTLVNCASTEYFTAVAPGALHLRVVTPVFVEQRGTERKVISFWAKRARGAMARFIVENRLTRPRDLTAFDSGGYRHVPELDEGDRLVFLRDAEEASAQGARAAS